MDCLFVRHGIAVAREEWEGKDVDRPLTENGRRRVRQVADGLRRLGVRPTVIYASPARRAVETAQLLHDLLARPSLMQLRDELLPEASPAQVVRLLRDLTPESCVICVGHEPQLGMAASVLLSGRATASFPLKKAGACLIELPIPTKPGRGVLRWWLTSGQLRAIGKGAKRSEVG
ncbi:MAG: histidine phosphatase family protein [Nitrospirae bacterium]|nr:histidine phosphatase family protein [Nitrospirota bacterium]MDE3042072.1 histidine phosphatase family protein [Nitrospirota bacterium]MDE3049698.1 histidine phosphatase family protein [Nitrospirota bacterium]MDE3218281.1 histidine phosphatase family protein [Nitrospirota bacterium]